MEDSLNIVKIAKYEFVAKEKPLTVAYYVMNSHALI
jgi:hypothetical protein